MLAEGEPVMGNWYKSGAPWIWLTAGAVSISLIAVLGLLLLIAGRGLSYFWPSPVYEWQLQNKQGTSVLIGQLYDRETLSAARLADAGMVSDTADSAPQSLTRYLVKTGNRERVGLDFRWINGSDIISRTAPAALAQIERSKNGNFYGYPVALVLDGKTISLAKDKAHTLAPDSAEPEHALSAKSTTTSLSRQAFRHAVAQQVARAVSLNQQAQRLQQQDIGAINYQLEQLRLQQRRDELNGHLSEERLAELEVTKEQLNSRYQLLEQQFFSLRQAAGQDKLIVRDMLGDNVSLPLSQVLAVTYPNTLSWLEKLKLWGKGMLGFVTDDPREANTEGGVFPAIFGTVFMVLLMAVIVTPFGVIAAIYLHEYAGNGPITRMIRIAVINLAGVPSIVYGVFGLGFFVYMLGGSLDQLFYPEALPSPTFGSPGVLWSALTLAILTLPVVIVSTEEGLSRIPSAVRHGSLALGATKAETLWRIVIPMASPAIMTGLILAVARAAGEVAPLMLVGVVKLAPTLPVDLNFPFVHLERKFMHLGFHIYDVGFQSPNVEAARPLVYATSFLLVSVIVALNLTAITVRNHLREKYRALEH